MNKTRLLIILIVSFWFASSLIAQAAPSPKTDEPKTETPPSASTTSNKFAHPLQVEPVSLFNKVRGNFTYWDKENPTSFERNRNLSVEGEMKLGNQFSFLATTGRNEYKITDSATQIGFDRIGFGVKYAKEFQWLDGDWIFGAGLRVFDRQRTNPISERENPDFYQIRPSVGLAYKSGDIQVQSELRFQSETTLNGRESGLQQFRRYYQFSIAPSIGLSEMSRLFVELEYREPYNATVDTKTRFFHLSPGFSFTTSLGVFGISYSIPVIPPADNMINQAIRFSYFYHF